MNDPNKRSDHPLGAHLRTLIQKSVDDYLAFTKEPPPSDHKKFAAYYSACRSALAHLDLLIKAAATKDTDGLSPSTPKDSLDRVVMEAQMAIAHFPKEPS